MTESTKPTIRIGADSFGAAVEHVMIAYMKSSDAVGLRLMVRANGVDIARAVRRALKKQAARDGYDLVVDGFEEMIAPRSGDNLPPELKIVLSMASNPAPVELED